MTVGNNEIGNYQWDRIDRVSRVKEFQHLLKKAEMKNFAMCDRQSSLYFVGKV